MLLTLLGNRLPREGFIKNWTVELSIKDPDRTVLMGKKSYVKLMLNIQEAEFDPPHIGGKTLAFNDLLGVNTWVYPPNPL